MIDPDYPDALPAQSRLHWYLVEKVLGQGGFGITYLARDTNLDQQVAIKEYLPVEVATRLPDATIRARTEGLRDRYRWGLERFIQEARTLARFDHRNIVRVHSVFEFNNTAYMVMRFESGTTLAALLDRRGTLPEDELLRIVLPILDGLELIHGAGFIHRDIKPDNIHIGNDGTPVLLDFGSARQALGTSHTLTILVAPGYAPFEQYYSDSGGQGPWTDIYSLGATCYRAIAGRAPLDAVARSKGILGSTQEVLVPATIIGAGRYSGRVLSAIDHALVFTERERPQTIAQWRAELLDSPVAPAQGADAMPGAQPVVPATSAPTQMPTRAASGTPAAAKESAPLAPLASTPRADARPAVPARKSLAWMVAGASLAVAGAGAYALFRMSTETHSKIDNLQAQFQEKDRAAQRTEAARAEAERAAREKAGDDARRRQEEELQARTTREEQARVALERNQADAQRKRDAAARVPAAEPKRADNVATARPSPASMAPPMRELAPAIGGATSRAQPSAASPVIAPMATVDQAGAAKALPTAHVVPEPDKPAPAPPPAEQIASADRAIAAGRNSDAIVALKTLADAGNAQAQNRLGDLYAEGRVIARDASAAEGWYEKAALQGDTAAQVKLGTMYASAGGAARNNNLAYVWFGTAARLGATAANAERDRIGALLQPAEREQADKLIESKVSRMPKKP